MERGTIGRAGGRDGSSRASAPRGGSSSIERAHHAEGTAIDDVDVDHRRPDVLVAEQGLDSADVRAPFQEVRREAVSQRVGRRALVELRGPYGAEHGLL